MNKSKETYSKDDMCRSWFCVLNNPSEHGYSDDPKTCCEQIAEQWCKDSNTRTCAITYCVSSQGLNHCHMVLEDDHNMRFSLVKKIFGSAHIEPTKGNKKQAKEYIEKKGKFAEKGEKILYTFQVGEIKGTQGKRNDLDQIEEYLNEGKTPNEIVTMSIHYAKYEGLIKRLFFNRKISNTPEIRDVNVFWHFGESGTGKTYEYIKLCEQYGTDNVFLMNDYDKGGLDNYSGQKILCMDEFRGQMRFSLLMQYLDRYKIQIPCRYSNSYALWNEIHIFTVYGPEQVYQKMIVDSDQKIDTLKQLMRRITSVIYHYIDEEGNYQKMIIPSSQYTSVTDVTTRVQNGKGLDDYVTLDNQDIPF